MSARALGVGYGTRTDATRLRGLPLYPNDCGRPWERANCEALAGSSCVQVYDGGVCARCGR